MTIDFAEYLQTIDNIRHNITTSTTENISQEIIQRENTDFLEELESILLNNLGSENPAVLHEQLTKLLAQRWQKDTLRNSFLDYTHVPHNTVNQLCLKIAKCLSEDNYYALLMPSLRYFEDGVTWKNIHTLKLHEFILSDDGTRPIPIRSCFDNMHRLTSRTLQHVVLQNEMQHFDSLTETEITRLKNHSLPVRKVILAVQDYQHRLENNHDLEGHLRRFLIAVRESNRDNQGTERAAGQSVYDGREEFNTYWNSLSESTRLLYLHRYGNYGYSTTNGLEYILEHLLGPLNTERIGPVQENIWLHYCTSALTNKLESLLSHYNFKSTNLFTDAITLSVSNYNSALRRDNYAMLSSTEIQGDLSVTYLKHLVLKPLSAQNTVCESWRQHRYANALHCALIESNGSNGFNQVLTHLFANHIIESQSLASLNFEQKLKQLALIGQQFKLSASSDARFTPRADAMHKLLASLTNATVQFAQSADTEELKQRDFINTALMAIAQARPHLDSTSPKLDKSYWEFIPWVLWLCPLTWIVTWCLSYLSLAPHTHTGSLLLELKHDLQKMEKALEPSQSFYGHTKLFA